MVFAVGSVLSKACLTLLMTEDMAKMKKEERLHGFYIIRQL